MRTRILQVLFICTFLIGCSADLSPLEKASVNYKNTKDYKSLETIYKHLSNKMRRQEAQRLLGEPDYSPVDGQYYYSSTRSMHSIEQNRDVTLGLVVDYRNKNGAATETLQKFWLGPIGE